MKTSVTNSHPLGQNVKELRASPPSLHGVIRIHPHLLHIASRAVLQKEVKQDGVVVVIAEHLVSVVVEASTVLYDGVEAIHPLGEVDIVPYKASVLQGVSPHPRLVIVVDGLEVVHRGDGPVDRV